MMPTRATSRAPRLPKLPDAAARRGGRRVPLEGHAGAVCVAVTPGGRIITGSWARQRRSGPTGGACLCHIVGHDETSSTGWPVMPPQQPPPQQRHRSSSRHPAAAAVPPPMGGGRIVSFWGNPRHGPVGRELGGTSPRGRFYIGYLAAINSVGPASPRCPTASKLSLAVRAARFSFNTNTGAVAHDFSNRKPAVTATAQPRRARRRRARRRHAGWPAHHQLLACTALSRCGVNRHTLRSTYDAWFLRPSVVAMSTPQAPAAGGLWARAGGASTATSRTPAEAAPVATPTGRRLAAARNRRAPAG